MGKLSEIVGDRHMVMTVAVANNDDDHVILSILNRGKVHWGLSTAEKTIDCQQQRDDRFTTDMVLVFAASRAFGPMFVGAFGGDLYSRLLAGRSIASLMTYYADEVEAALVKRVGDYLRLERRADAMCAEAGADDDQGEHVMRRMASNGDADAP